ncbi:MAG: DUF86 domain-containing protein [Thermoanaerobacteraceae bacterium]|uniref:DUF86 domain-containing protein n=1 Tax=Thermoanaerobacter uzonensis DSM 18761 TaxID=1123369 RepID=A0A1M5AQU8_9THEO|nr:HepT-like ribonuclease domain-containing protein [Thermoanaerobacter uzonensis]SHF32544.1 Protein of unknown function DUF86 [Thermoanaerobacter uzonensis DSM 18761]
MSKVGVLPQTFARGVSSMVSFRNILVYDYMKVEERMIVDILKNHLDDFVKYIDYINKWIDENY